MRILILFSLLFLSACSVENDTGSTEVSISLGQTTASGAIGAAGSIPASVQSVSVAALSPTGKIIAGSIIANRPNFTVKIRVPNGNGIRFRILAFDTKDAKGIVLYETLSAPVNLKGKPVTVPVKMSLSVKVAADKTSTFRGGIVNLIGKVSGNTPNTSSPLLWAKTGGTLANTDPYGATNTWTAPATLGSYTIAAYIDPYTNPDQDPNVKGSVKINVINRDPYIQSFNTTPITAVGGIQTTINLIVAGDLDGDSLQVGSPDKPTWVSFITTGSNPLTAQLQLSPPTNTSGSFTFNVVITDGFGGRISKNVSVTVTVVTSPSITLIGSNIISTLEGQTYSDPGATAINGAGVDISSRIITTNPVLSNVPGIYTVTYNVSDSLGNSATPVTRTVLVKRIVTGAVKDATNAPVTSANVSIALSTSILALTQAPIAFPITPITVTTDSYGNYSTELAPSTYTVVASKSGFNDASTIYSLTPTGSTTLPVITLSQTSTALGDITGLVKNSINNNPLPLATIKLRQGVNAPNSASVIKTTTSSSTGSYIFTGLPAGTYTVTSSLAGFTDASVVVTVSGGVATTANPILMSPALSAGQTRIVLSWGANPSDLDAHLIGPQLSPGINGSNEFHIYFGELGNASISPYAQLDFDVTSGLGPETITISQASSGKYRYYVHDYTNGGVTTSTGLTGTSTAVVRVFQGTSSTPVATFNVPVTGAGDTWHVFDLNGQNGTIIPINQITNARNEPSNLTLNQPNTLPMGHTTNLSPTIQNLEGVGDVVVFNGNITSSNPAIATVNTFGTVTPVSVGTTTFTAVDTYSGLSASSTVSIVANAIPTVSINSPASSIAGDGGSLISSSLLSVTDADNSASELIYTLSSIPTKGILSKLGVALAVGGTFTQSDVNSGHISFAASPSTSGADSFIFSVDDGAGGNTGSITYTINITLSNAKTILTSANNNIFIAGTNCNTTWDIYGSPYYARDSIDIASGCRLQIDPYVAVKFNSGTGIFVQASGTLDIYGVPNAPVIMTTVNDDTVAGAFAGSTGAPAIGSWSGIQYQAASLGSISDAQVHYANNALEIASASPTITNFTATEFGGIGLYLRTFAANHIASPAVTNIVLTTSDALNQPIYMTSSTTDTTQIIAPVINGTSITTASTNTAFGAIHLSGIGVNPTISNMTINGGGYNLYATNNASGVFTNNTFNGAASEAIYLSNNANGIISINSTNTITNAPAPYAMNQAFPSVDIYASIGTGVIDTYSVHLSGNFNATNSILVADPLNTGASAYVIASSIAVNSGSRLQIDPYTVMKFNSGTSMIIQGGATLDIYGAPSAPVIMTTVNDDSVAPIFATSTGIPVIGSWSGIQYQAGSLGSISNAQVHYANNALEIAAASPIITNFTATEFGGIGLYLRTFAANQIASPTVTNIALTTSDAFNYPMYMTSSTTDATQIIAPIINGTSITTASTSTSAGAIHLSGIGVNPTISNMVINGGGYGLRVFSNASATVKNSIIRDATTVGVQLNTTGNVTLNNNNIVNNPDGIIVDAAGAGSVFENNLIRGNAGNGVVVAATQTAPITVRNNLIGENGTGIHVVGDTNPLTLTPVTIQNNTIGGNLGAGLLLDTYTSATLNYNIFASNPTADVSSTSLNTTTNYNLTTDGSLATGGGSTDGYANPQFIQGFYISDGSGLNGNNTVTPSPAIDPIGLLSLASSQPFITTNPYSQPNIGDSGVLDLGFHHANPAPTIAPVASTIVTNTLTPSINGTVTITITPKDAAGNVLGSGLLVTATISQAGNTTGTIGLPKDLGDGTYQVIFTASAVVGGSDTVFIIINGTPITATAPITW